MDTPSASITFEPMQMCMLRIAMGTWFRGKEDSSSPRPTKVIKKESTSVYANGNVEKKNQFCTSKIIFILQDQMGSITITNNNRGI